MRRRCLCVLILACALCARAQPVPAPQNPPLLRAEGRTELISDGVFVLSGGVPTAAGLPIPASTICFAFVSPVKYTITSRTLPASPGDDGLPFTEALLVIGDPPPDRQFLCQAPNNNCVNYAGAESNKNVFRAKLTNCPLPYFPGRALVWENIPVDPPGSDSRVIYRLTNLRVDATSATSAAPVNGALMIGSIAAKPQQAAMGLAQPSLSFSVVDAPPPTSLTSQCLVVPRRRIGTLQFAERFPGAFRPRSPAVFTTTERSPDPVDNASPVHPFTTETGFYNHLFGGPVPPGLADHGTRVEATFKNIPAGATILVDAVNSSGTARLVDGNSVPFVPLGAASDMAPLQPINGTATAVWEVMRDDPSVTNNLDFGVYLTNSPPPDAPPLLANITVQGGYAPPAGRAEEIPSFADTSIAVPLVQFGSCVLVITTKSPLPPGVVGTPYSQQLDATAGPNLGALIWAPTGALPPGLSLDRTGLLSGTPTMRGPQFCFVATVTSGSLQTGKEFCVRISDLPIVTMITSPVDVVVGVTPPLPPLMATGGTPPYIWSIVSGSLPSGIALNPDGTFAGQALNPLEHPCVTVQVSDAFVSQQTEFCVNVLGLVTMRIAGLPPGVGPNSIQAVQVMLQGSYPRDIVVTLTADFQRDALAFPVNPGVVDPDDPDADDSEVGFPGGRTTTFPISMGSTLGPLMTLRTGTVAGAITIRASANLPGPGGTVIGADQQVATVPLMR
ncbi:MAG TPA: Ig domain-containing protein, partial [Bryobacteraceae bacterium]